jgi:hypothetical protein
MARTTQPAPPVSTRKSSASSSGKTPPVSAAVKNFLKGAKGNWSDQVKQAKENTFKELPHGIYRCRLSSAEIGESQSENPQITWKYTVVSGTEIGQTITKWTQLEGENSLYYLAQELIRFGLDPDEIDPSDLPQVLADLVEEAPLVTIKLAPNKKNPEYTDKWLQGKTEPSEEDSDDSEEENEEAEEESAPEPPKKRGRPAKAAVAAPEPEDEDEDSEEDEDSDEEEEDESEEEEDEEEDVKVGDNVRCVIPKVGKKAVVAVVRDINEDEGKIKVAYEKKLYWIEISEDMEIVAED